MKIRVFCNLGMSTSLVVSKMKKVAKERNLDCDIEAFSVSEVSKEGPGSDAVLLGPQISYKLNEVRTKLPGVPVDIINMADYGLANGAAILDAALAMMKK